MKYSNLLKIHERNTYNILMIDNGQLKVSAGELFKEATEDGQITRTVHVYSGEKSSKVVNLFLICEKYFDEFIAKDELAFKIDLAVFMDS